MNRIIHPSILINSPYAKPLPPAPPRNGEGSLLYTPPALSGKGDGGLGRMRKVELLNPFILIQF
ncbi:MAG: hypothetical protein BWK80_49420 [Desulfobacteraceae bacterium IS3]|nr:MAG: hypothetical protein BWK80_49420 [Desulfobacteraceae bacterium IS3]